MRVLWLNFLLATHAWVSQANAAEAEQDYYSSIYGLENLLSTEAIILTELQQYVDATMRHVEALQSEIASIRVEHVAASRDMESYLSNPVNAYRLLKRLQHDWRHFEEIVRASDTHRAAFLTAMQYQREHLSFPSESDVFGATVALARLQDTYKLDVAEVASGVLNSVKYGTAMSWHDCFLVGHHLYAINDFNRTIPWLQESMRLLSSEVTANDEIALDFMEAVATYHRELGDFGTALSLTNQVLAYDSSRKQLYQNRQELQMLIRNGMKVGLIHETIPSSNNYHHSDEFKLYGKVCRSEITTTPTQLRSLRCRYHTNGMPYRRLQPFKLEELSLDPYIVRFHDVIRDHQIEQVKRLASRSLHRSKILSDDGSHDMVSIVRNSKNAWFDYYQHRVLRTMRRHLREFSGLDVQHIELMQIANYGIGGQYEPHWDFFSTEDFLDSFKGNRLATAIYYLSSVEEGGATAFPYLPLLVRPEKGSVLFWYNLHRSLEPDYRTKHAACPVLKGSKWIANIWIRSLGQDRSRACALSPDHEISLPWKDT